MGSHTISTGLVHLVWEGGRRGGRGEGSGMGSHTFSTGLVHLVWEEGGREGGEGEEGRGVERSSNTNLCTLAVSL